MDMLRLEYDIQHHLVLSKRHLRDHALIRTIISTLSTSAELKNICKRDLRKVRGKNFEFHTIKLSSPSRTRISPIDQKTYEILMSLNTSKPFQLSEEKIDEIVSKYSPADRKYNVKSLRKAMIRLLQDATLFEVEFEKLSLEEMYAYMLDFNPIYSGVWEFDDEEDVEEFILNYADLTGSNAESIASKLGKDEDYVRKILESGKKGLISFKNSKDRVFKV
ncbi:hypothetical protein DRP04_12200 [Archaeoglobales archaeon]|nr:MAG: hypothetical protein DRP04_12200 [Archaeoglobales archaeon]